MNIDYLVQLLNNRLNALALAKDQAFMAGDLERINTVDAEILGVNDTLYKLNLLTSVSAVAAATGTTEASVVSNGIDAVVDSGALLAEATQCLSRYDITPYATDPLHEEKVATILRGMPLVLDTADKIQAYILSVAPNSPITGIMVLAATQVYAVDTRLALALMQQDSLFGTLGVAVPTMNPGNVGNTGTETRTYASWAEGVTAVAEWLSRHHKVVLSAEEIKGTIQYETVPTSTIAIPLEAIATSTPSTDPTSTPSTNTTTTPSSLGDTSVSSSTPEISTSTPETSTPSTTIQEVIENLISPTSTESVVTSTDPVISEVVENVVTSTVEDVVTGGGDVVSSTVEEVVNTVPVVDPTSTVVENVTNTIN